MPRQLRVDEPYAKAFIPIRSFEDYFAGDDGFIYSLRGHGGTLKSSVRKKKLSGHHDSYGYLMVTLRKRGRSYEKRVHALVCEAFHGPRPPGLQVLHGAGGRRNNRPENLSWGSPRQNAGPDRLRDGTDFRGENNPAAKTSAEQVRRMREYAKAGWPYKEIAGVFGISSSQVGAIIRGEKWGWLDAKA